MVKTGRWLVIAGSVVLFCTAFVHGAGYSAVTGAVEKSGAEASLLSAFKGLWLAYSAHLLVLSAVFGMASRTPKGKRIVLLGVLIPAADTVLLFHFIGIFVGTILLAVATVFLVAGGFLLPDRISSEQKRASES